LIRRALVFCLLAALTGCKPNEVSKTKAIIGAVLIDGNGGPPITDSVVLVSGSRIRSAGLRANVPIPADADKINGSGKFLIPGLIDLYCTDNENRRSWLDAGVTTTRLVSGRREFTGQISDPDLARRKVAELTAERVDFLFIRADDGRLSPAVADAILEEARKSNLPVTASVTSLAQAEQLVKSGVAGFVRMITDTEDLDQAFLAKLRALNIVFTPVLTVTRDEGRSRAMRNTKRMAAAGVPIGLGSGASSAATQQELELLVEAGLSPLDVATAATRNGALALRKLAELGTIEAGKRADLVLLNANPLEDVRNFRKIDRVMLEGEWVAPPSR
jgi:imidazolonepropionase-like amidohydrolase